jgi:flagellar biosynthetic protein FliO
MSDEHRASESNNASAAGMLVRTLGALLLIIGIIFAVGWTLKRFGGARFNSSTEARAKLETLSTVSLGDKQTLALVRVGAQTILVGATPHSITFLANYSETNETPAPRTVADLLEEDFSLDGETFNDAPRFVQSPVESIIKGEREESFDAHLSAAFSSRSNAPAQNTRAKGEIG